MPTAAHTKEMLDKALAIYAKVGKEMGYNKIFNITIMWR